MIISRSALALSIVSIGMLWTLACADARASGDDRTVDLSMSLEEGHEWRYRYSVNSKLDLEMLGEEHTFSMAKEVTVRLRVMSAEDGNAEVELVHEKIRLEVDGDHPGSFDSSKPRRARDDNIYAKMLGPLIDVPLTLDVDDEGRIRRVRGLENFRPKAGLEAELFRNLFGADEIIRMYAPLFSLKPDDPIARVGNSWSIEQRRSEGLGIFEIDLRLEVTGITRRDAMISIGGNERVGIGEDASEALASDSKIKGTAIWNHADGVLRRLTTNSLTTFGPNPDATMGIQIKGKARAETTLWWLESAGP